MPDLSAQLFTLSDYLIAVTKLIGIDNHNDYYDPALKEARLERHINHENYTPFKIDIEDGKAIEDLFKEHQFDGEKFSCSGRCSIIH